MNQFYFNLNDYLNTSVKIYGEKNAIITAKQSLNYNDLYNNVICTANLLILNGIKKGDRVVVCIGNELESVVLFWAVLRVGGIVSLISPELSINKISYVMQDSGAKLLFSSKDTGLKLQDFDSSSLIEYKNIYYEDLLELTKEDFMIKLKSKVIDTDLASIIYTSGSTGEPKGVMMTHKNMLTAAASIINYLEYSSIDNILCCLPLSFDYGLYQMIMAVAVGATLILEKNFTLPLQFLRKIEKYQVTVIPLVPSMVPILINYNAKFNCDLSSVRKVTNTGAALNLTHIEEVKRLFANAKVFSMYGLTECKRCTYLPPEYLDKKPNSVGIAIPNTELWVVDEYDNRLGPNQIGQLVIRGGTIMQGYWNKPEQTQKKLKDYNNEKVFYTGDLCYLDEDGFLYFHGRMDEVIKSRGVKVSPKEVEDVIMSLPHIKEVAVVGVNDDLYGEIILAAVSLKENINDTEIISYCKSQLELEKVPQKLLLLDSLPKSINGKYDKLAIKNLFLQAN